MGDALGVEERAGAEELVSGRGLAAVLDQLGPGGRRSLEQVRGGGAELVGEHAPDLAVVGRARLAAQVGAHRPLVLPAEAGDGLLGDLVAGGDATVDAVGAVLVEGLGDRQRLGAAADALAADVVADQRASSGAVWRKRP